MRRSLLTSTDTYRTGDGQCRGGTTVPVGERTLWVVVLASVALDVATTWIGLGMGLAEGNPVMRRAIDGTGIAALVAAKLAVVGVAACLRSARPRYGTAIASGLALPWTVTVLVNAVALTTV